jgi:hypothetical protein
MGRTEYLQRQAREYLSELLKKGEELEVDADIDHVLITCGGVTIEIDVKSQLVHLRGKIEIDLGSEIRYEDLGVSVIKPHDFLLVETVAKLLRQKEMSPEDALDRILGAKTQAGWIIRTDGKTGITDIVE